MPSVARCGGIFHRTGLVRINRQVIRCKISDEVLSRRLHMGVDLDQKVGGTKSENYWFEKPSFLNFQKRQKSKFWGFYFFYLSCNL